MAPDLAEAAFEVNPDALIVVDQHGLIVAANPATYSLFGHAPGSLIGRSVEVLVPAGLHGVHERHRAQYGRHPGSRPMGIGLGLSGQRADGSEVPVEISLSPIATGTVAGTIATVRDVTERLVDRTALRSSNDRLQLLEERERIGRDLHDMVIQRLFATGMSLQAVADLAEPDDVRERIIAAVDELDDTIRDIRNTIFALQRRGAATLAERVEQLVVERSGALGFEPLLHIAGSLDQVALPLADDLLATLGEALSNVARHANATSVYITIDRHAGALTLRVVDDGVGMDAEPVNGRGLTNMLWRAANAGGRCRIEPAQPRGTELEWRVPLVDAS